ncbi:hypothetical protein CFP56_033506 [Quercus suber]|uniref:Uncharacterized protein n=1 Tax=Quercus suber TaxID=58331 RepID=A0AAW0JF81_QUESU
MSCYTIQPLSPLTLPFSSRSFTLPSLQSDRHTVHSQPLTTTSPLLLSPPPPPPPPPPPLSLQNPCLNHALRTHGSNPFASKPGPIFF